MSENTDATRTDDDLKLGEEYDKARAEQTDEVDEIDDNRKVVNGVVVTGTEVQGTQTLYPGAEDVTAGGTVIREARGLSTDDVVETDDTTWTAQSAVPYVASNAADVPGQTFTLDELPDPKVMAASGLPAHTLPANLLVDGAITDSIHPSQERGSDAGTSAKRDGDGEAVAAKPVAKKAAAKAGT